MCEARAMTALLVLPGALEVHLAGLVDRRVRRTQRYPLTQIVFMTFCGVLAGCQGWDGLAAFTKAKRAWFAQWFDLPHGTPCSDTFQRVLERLAPGPFAAAFDAWLAHLRRDLRGELVALDGKAIKGAFTAAERTTPLYLLHVWATHQKCLLGQIAVAGAPGELAGITTMLSRLVVAGAILATDANGCTQKNAAAMRAADAAYLFGLKGNRGAIHAETRALFAPFVAATLPAPAAPAAPAAPVAPATLPAPVAPRALAPQMHREVDKGHGRREERMTWTLPADLLPAARRAAWKDLTTLVCVARSRTIGTTTSHETHYYLTSQTASAATLATQIRTYWSVENQLHWVLDVTMGEDRCRVRDATAAENLATLRRHSLALLNQPAAGRASLAMKQRTAGWDDAYLTTLLRGAERIPEKQAQ
jgi:predicted transposase YbfD/YdcC